MILAGGKGSRIGRDKKTLSLNGASVMTNLITRLKDVFNEIIISSNNNFEHENTIILPDDIGAGPLAGIYQGLRYCKSEFLYVIACDMPFVSDAYINFIKDKVGRGGGALKYDACVAQTDDGFLEPFNALYGKTCIESVRAALESGEYRILPVLKKLRLCLVQNIDVNRFCAESRNSLFFNINYKTDLQEAEELLRNPGISSMIKRESDSL